MSGELERDAARARAAASELTAAGRPTDYLRTLFVPADETCFYVFTSRDRRDVAEACRLAGIEFDRILDAVDSGGTYSAAMQSTGNPSTNTDHKEIP